MMWNYDGGLGHGYLICNREGGEGGIEMCSWEPTNSSLYRQFKLGTKLDSDYTGLWLPRLFSGAGDYPLKWASASGAVTYETSARRFKQDIAPYTDDGLLYKVNPVYYRYISDPARLHVGLIADDLALIDTSNMYVIYDNDNQPEGVRYDKFITPLIACVQSQNKQIQDILAQIEELRSLVVPK